MLLHITFHPYRQTIIASKSYFPSTQMEIMCTHTLFFIHADRTNWLQLPVFQTDTALHHIHYLSYYTVCHPDRWKFVTEHTLWKPCQVLATINITHLKAL